MLDSLSQLLSNNPKFNNPVEKKLLKIQCDKLKLLVPSTFNFSPPQSFLPFQVVFNPFPNKPWFLHVCSTSLFKTLLEKEKAIFPFPTMFSTHLENFLPFSSNLDLSSAISFSLEESNFSFGKGLSPI